MIKILNYLIVFSLSHLNILNYLDFLLKYSYINPTPNSVNWADITYYLLIALNSPNYLLKHFQINPKLNIVNWVIISNILLNYIYNLYILNNILLIFYNTILIFIGVNI